MDDDPYTLIIALDRDVSYHIFRVTLALFVPCTLFIQGDAMGKIYIDDGHSYDYKSGKFLFRRFTFTTNTLIGGYKLIDAVQNCHSYHMYFFFFFFLFPRTGDPAGTYETKSWLEKIIVVGITGTPTAALLSCGESVSFWNKVMYIRTFFHNLLPHPLSTDGVERNLDISFDDVHKNHVLTIRKPCINISRDFSITLS